MGNNHLSSKHQLLTTTTTRSSPTAAAARTASLAAAATAKTSEPETIELDSRHQMIFFIYDKRSNFINQFWCQSVHSKKDTHLLDID